MTHKEVVEFLETILRLAFGARVPTLLLRVSGIVVIVTGVLYLGYAALVGVGKIRRLWLDELSPMFYDATKRRRVLRRQRFADHLESELRRLNNDEEWRDYRYTELEAEVEAEGETHRSFVWQLRGPNSLRRERSLSRALAKSDERLILLEGEPGAGKSVALRHVARVLANRAMHSRSLRTVIPLYINLKTLDRETNTPIGPDLIEKHVLQTLNRFNSRDIDEFLVEELSVGMREGTWFFLFDSFDEIPEVLSSDVADDTLLQYAQAIADFLSGMNICRGVVASRHFRGPRSLMWPRFRLLELSDSRRESLIRRADLPRDLERELLQGLPVAVADVAAIARNPMFLGLVCEFVRDRHAVPESAHVVFESYIDSRLQRDASKLRLRFKLDAAKLRHEAEELAIRMIERPDLGLSPLRQDLLEDSSSASANELSTCLDALEYIRLGRREDTPDGPTFTYAHRRFQEYFATCAAIRQPDRIDTRLLLLDGRWRETAVTMLQIQPLQSLVGLFDSAVELLRECIDELSLQVSVSDLFEHPELFSIGIKPRAFVWPKHSLHLLSLIQSGLAARIHDVPPDLPKLTGHIIRAAFSLGTLVDRRWALELVGAADQRLRETVIRNAFQSRSHWLAEAAFAQTARLLCDITDLHNHVCDFVLSEFALGRLNRSWGAARAQLLRLSDMPHLVHAAQLLRHLSIIDAATHATILCTLYYALPRPKNVWTLPWLIIPIVLCIWSLRFVARTRDMEWITFIVVVARGVIAAILISLMATATHSIGAACLTGLLSVWPLFAIGAARHQLFIRPAWWPLLFLWPAAIFIRYIVRERIEAAFLLRESIVPMGFIIVTATTTMVIGYLSIESIALVAAVIGVLSLPVGAVVLAKPAWAAAQEIVFWLSTRWRVRSGVTVGELRGAIERLSGRRLQTSLVRFVRRRDLIAPSPTAAAEMYVAALDVENSIGKVFDVEAAELLDEMSRLAAALRQRQAFRAAASPSDIILSTR